MCASLRRSCALSYVFLMAAVLGTMIQSAARGAPARTVAAGPAVEFFAALEAGSVDARLIPRDDRRATVWIENKTEQPLSIRMPVAFAGVPVLAQLFPDPGPFPPPGGRDAAPQNIGFPGNAFPAMDFGGGGPAGGPFGGPGIFNVPAGKTIKTRVPCVCLEHGKPNPKPRVPYKIVPIESVSEKPELAELLGALGTERYPRRVVQAAAWHLANDMTWEQLDGLRIEHITGRQERWFHPTEIETARKLVERLPSVKARATDGEDQGDSLARHTAWRGACLEAGLRR